MIGYVCVWVLVIGKWDNQLKACVCAVINTKTISMISEHIKMMQNWKEQCVGTGS